MLFDNIKKAILSDTIIPDVFIQDYLPELSSDAVKLYLYCLFMSKHDKNLDLAEISYNLSMTEESVKTAFLCLKKHNLIIKGQNKYLLTDLKEQVILKYYEPKDIAPSINVDNTSEKNRKRISAIDSINNMCFGGVMSPSMYTLIDNMFEKYNFDPDVMVSLFMQCAGRGITNRKYIETVALDWNKNNIQHLTDMELYLEKCSKREALFKHIKLALGLKRELTQYEKNNILKWSEYYKFSFNIIELALKQTNGKRDPFNYVDKVLTVWFNNGLKSVEQIKSFMQAAPTRNTSPAAKKTTTYKNQRKYSNEFLNKFNKTLNIEGENE